MAKKTRKLTAAHKKALSEGQRRRRKRERTEADKASTTPRKHARVLKNARAPDGVHVLSRIGGGKDIVQCNAVELMEALRVLRKIKQMVC